MAASVGALLNDAKCKSWFVDALNGSVCHSRNLSDPATMDCLLTGGSDSYNDLEAAAAAANQGDFFGIISRRPTINPRMCNMKCIRFHESTFEESNTSFSSVTLLV
ncbi:hypothetical protein M0R45_025611 [Rubus argutus]|uniref:Uncharacterized protein n=1 Tax=Rubus argutus TaxID=59490 RepID=A0AAW1WV47_RUBAR